MKTSIIDKISIGLFAITLFTVGFFIYAYQTNQFEKHEHGEFRFVPLLEDKN